MVGQSPNEDALIQLALSERASHRAAADEFLSQAGVQARSVDRTSVGGFSATVATFTASGQGGSVSGVAAFIDYSDRVYQLLGYTPTSSFERYHDTFLSVVRSFRRLTDREALNVQPLRVDLQTVSRSTTLAALFEDQGSPISLDELALVNGIDADTALERGDRIKWIVGTLPPEG